jgi:hypothetical protein
MAKTLEQQLICAIARARIAKIVLICIGSGEHGFRAEVTSERARSTTYTITRDTATGDLVCTCPATVVCKHIGATLLAGASFHSNAKRPEDVPVTPNPNRPELEPPAPSAASTFAERQAAANAAHAAQLRARYGEPDLVWVNSIIDDDLPASPIAVTEEEGLAELLGRDSTDDEWEADERPEAGKQAEAERRAEWMCRQTQAEIERASDRRIAAGLTPHPYDGRYFWDNDTHAWLPKPALAEVAR